MRIKFITLTCEKYHNTRVESIRETWGRNQDVSFLSDVNLGDDIIGFEYLQKGYENVWMKYAELLKNIKSYDYDWYFFTDDDTFVNIDKIESLLKNQNKEEPICLGHMGALNTDGKDMDGVYTGFPLGSINGKDTQLPLYYLSGGAGFILSNASMKLICDYIRSLDFNEIPKAYNGDVTIGFWIRNSGIKIIDIVGFYWTNPKELNHDDDKVKECYTYHYIDHNQMKNM